MKLWQKENKLHPMVEEFTIGKDPVYDQYLLKFDLKASIAHARMLGETGIIDPADSSLICDELEKMLANCQRGEYMLRNGFEDMHSQIEFDLIQQLGDVGKKVHTARSRNDQVLVALRLYMLEKGNLIAAELSKLIATITDQAAKHKGKVLPGYTHMQVAMPCPAEMWLGAYAESFQDDLLVLKNLLSVLNKNPLGSAAGFGTQLRIDINLTTHELGFSKAYNTALGASLSRGKSELMLLSGISLVASTLGRLAMDNVLYLSQNFGFISYPNEFTTGSSIMPHKRNPDPWELIRAKCNQLQTLPVQIQSICINLPSGYHRDYQEIKTMLINGVESLLDVLKMANLLVPAMEVKEGIQNDPQYKEMYTVERIDQLVAAGVPFRDAYLKVKEELFS